VILFAVLVFISTRKPDMKGPENTDKISGILSKSVKNGTFDHKKYVGFWVEGYNGFYKFSSCSYNAEIEKKISLLNIWDSITLYAEKKRSSYSKSKDGDEYNNYRVCAANSPKHGIYLTFSEFNDCLRSE
jgi:hypothetical protein